MAPEDQFRLGDTSMKTTTVLLTTGLWDEVTVGVKREIATFCDLVALPRKCVVGKDRISF
jgi:hypothetical protein